MVPTHKIWRRLLLWAAGSSAFASVFFLIASHTDLPLAWVYLGITSLLGLWVALAVDSGLVAERNRPGPGGADHFTWLCTSCLFAAHWIIAPVDIRWHLTNSVPTWLQAIGLVGYAVASGFTIWAVVVNRFFSPIVRLQEERGHHLISHGPYRLVRHPGYLGMVIAVPCSGLALGSWLALIPATAYALVILRRAAFEDQYLRRHLDGYQTYADAVRYRLVPGIW